MKREVYGQHHSVSEAHLHRYLTEWDFKWNTRKMNDGERAALALKGAEGKRSRTGNLNEARTIKQKAKRFIAWRKRRSSS
jgi:hypothetical protein